MRTKNEIDAYHYFAPAFASLRNVVNRKENRLDNPRRIRFSNVSKWQALWFEWNDEVQDKEKYISIAVRAIEMARQGELHGKVVRGVAGFLQRYEQYFEGMEDLLTYSAACYLYGCLKGRTAWNEYGVRRLTYRYEGWKEKQEIDKEEYFGEGEASAQAV